MILRILSTVLGLILLLLPAALTAQTYEFAISGNESTSGNPERTSERGAAVNFDFEAQLKLGLLLDEPVISLRMRYELVGGVVTTPTFEPGEDRFETRQLDLLPTDAFERLRLYDAKIRFTLDAGTGDSVEIIVDAGHLNPSGEWSFNVPGSPNWDELFIVSGSIFQDNEPSYYDRDSARAIWASGLTLSAWEIMDIRLSQYAMHQWYAQNNERDRFQVISRAIKQVEKGIAASYGYQFRADDRDPLLDGFTVFGLELEAESGWLDGRVEYDKAQWQRVLARAEQRFLKLTSLPPELVTGDNHEPYEAAVRNAQRLLQLTGRNIEQFKPDGVDVAALAKGKEVEFTNQVSNASQQSRQKGDVKVWTISSYLGRKNKLPNVGEMYKLGSKISTKGTVLSRYQVTSQQPGCELQSGSIFLFMEGYVDKNKISRYSRNADIYTTREEAEERLKVLRSNRSYPLVEITSPRPNACPD